MSKLLKPRERQNLLFERVNKIKPNLPKDWRRRLVLSHPEYDSLEMADYIARVHATRASDETLTAILEKIEAEFQTEKLNISKIINRQRIILPT